MRFRVCAYASRRTSTLWIESNDRGNAEPTTFTWAVGGAYAALSGSDSGTDDGTSRGAGVSTEHLTIWNSRTGKSTVPCCSVTGLRFSELLVSPTGSVAAIGNPYRFVGGEESRPATESAVVVFEPKAPKPAGSSEQVWRRIASGPPGTLSGLALSGRTVVWTGPTGLAQSTLQ